MSNIEDKGNRLSDYPLLIADLNTCNNCDRLTRENSRLTGKIEKNESLNRELVDALKGLTKTMEDADGIYGRGECDSLEYADACKLIAKAEELNK